MKRKKRISETAGHSDVNLSPRGEVADRGVYKALYRIAGHEVLCGIDSHGNLACQRILPGDDDDEEFAGVRALEVLLDSLDPVSTLTLVK